MERAMNIQEVILRAVAKKIRWAQAGEMTGASQTHHNKLIFPIPTIAMAFARPSFPLRQPSSRIPSVFAG